MRMLNPDSLDFVWVEEIAKADTRYCDVDEIIGALRRSICRHNGLALIGVFDHYGLNLRLGEFLPLPMQDAKAILFCPGSELVAPAFLALCPCAVGVADMGNRFVISLSDRMSAHGTEILQRWVDELRMPDRATL